MERGTRFFEVALAMYDKRKAVIFGLGEEAAFEIESLRADGRVSLSGFDEYVDMMDIVRFEETTKPVRVDVLTF